MLLQQEPEVIVQSLAADIQQTGYVFQFYALSVVAQEVLLGAFQLLQCFEERANVVFVGPQVDEVAHLLGRLVVRQNVVQAQQCRVQI